MSNLSAEEGVSMAAKILPRSDEIWRFVYTVVLIIYFAMNHHNTSKASNSKKWWWFSDLLRISRKGHLSLDTSWHHIPAEDVLLMTTLVFLSIEACLMLSMYLQNISLNFHKKSWGWLVQIVERLLRKMLSSIKPCSRQLYARNCSGWSASMAFPHETYATYVWPRS